MTRHRRAPRRLRRRLLTAVLVATAVAAPMAAAGVGAGAEPPAPRTQGPTTPIRHLVLVMQDHRSFDHYFGSRAGVDGLPKGVCLPAGPSADLSGCVAPFHLNKGANLTPFNDGRGYLMRQLHGGRMDGFVTAYAGTAADGRMTMGYYDRHDLPYYWRLADQYVLFDHFFSALPANGVANRFLAITGAPPPHGATRVPLDGWPETPTVFDRLTAAGVSWKIYAERYGTKDKLTDADLMRLRARVPLLALPQYREPGALRGHVVDLEQYYADAAANRLPAVSYVVATGPTERPPSPPKAGQRFSRALVMTLQASPAWRSSALMLTYDSSGGWYDHVPPPAFQGRPRGARVPALLVSPYAKRGVVDSSTLDVASQLRFIEDNWRLPALTARDASAGSLLGAFDFKHPRPADITTSVGSQPPTDSPTLVIYLLYGFAVTFVATTLLWLRRRPGSTPAVRPALAPSLEVTEGSTR